MKVELKGIVLDVVTSEYEFEGKKGVTHKVHLYADGTLYKIGIEEVDVSKYIKLVGQETSVYCNVYIKGTYNLKIAK